MSNLAAAFPAAPLRLYPSLQTYAWGDATFLPNLLGLPVDGRTYAEAWFGAHPSAPATVATRGEHLPLDVLLAKHPALLGRDVAERFGQMPYLLKLLAAARPLSIQAHPDIAQARDGYQREQSAGVPVDSPHRSYRDANHKPELIVALTPFEVLSGFRPPEAIAEILAQLPGIARELPSFDGRSFDIAKLINAYFRLPKDVWSTGLRTVLEAPRANTPDSLFGKADELVRKVFAQTGGHLDRGLFLVYLLEHVCLQPGEGLFMKAGVPHAYLSGAGVELMASSDNVLRAGLTDKHIDVDELQRIVDFDARRPAQLRATAHSSPNATTYETPAAEFALTRLEIDAGSAQVRAATGPETLLVTAGTTVLIHADSALELDPGQACFVPAGTEYRLEAMKSTVFLAGVP